MIDISSKKVQLALRFFTYGVMAVSTVILTIFAVYYAMGYRLSPGGLVIEQGGIVEFRTEPSNARVSIDGKQTSNLTPARAYVGPGNHIVRMQLNGYRTWEKAVSLQPGQLLWLDYTRFIPQTITTTPVKEFAALADAKASPDRRRIILQELPNLPTFTIVEVGNPKDPPFTPHSLPDAALTKVDGKLGTFTLLEWSQDSRYILVRHTNGPVNEVLRFDTSDTEATVNLTRQFGVALGDVHFATNNSSVVYTRVADELRRLDIPGNTASVGIVPGVTQFTVFEDRIAFVANRAQSGQVVGVFQDGKETIVASTAPDKQVRVALADYFRHQQFAYTLGDGKVVVVSDPTISNPAVVAEFGVDQSPAWLQFSPKGRFVIAGNGQTFTGYDLEVGRPYNGQLVTTKAPEWLDPFHIWTDTNDILRLQEFDGQNSNDITSVASGFTVLMSLNEKVLFSFNKNGAGTFTLQASGLVN